MRERTLLVPVPYYHYSPHPVIIGLRRAVTKRLHDERVILDEIADESPGWQTLAYCQQVPVGWRNRSVLRVVESRSGAPVGVPHDLWNPAT